MGPILTSVRSLHHIGLLPAGAQFVDAHSCLFQGRRFGHVILKYHDQLISVLVTDAQPDGLRLPTAGQMTNARADGYQLTGFETARHAVFVVSNLTDEENMAIARAIARSLAKHIHRAEQTA